MKAVLISGNRKAEVVERPMPRAHDDWVVVKVTVAAICGTDIELLWHSEGTPVVPGHETAGVVHEVAGDTGYKVGDRVLVNCHVTCESCQHCKNGDLIFCPELKAVGFDLDGGDAEYVVVPAASLRPIPDDISDELAVLAGDSLGTPWGAMQKIMPVKGKTVAVFGVGPIGMMAVLCLAHEGATVVAVDMNARRLASARDFGATHTVDLSTQDVLEEAKRLTGGEGFDATMQCTGSEKAVRQSLDSLRVRGTMVQVGVCNQATINPYEQISARELTVLGSRNFCDHRLPDLYDLLRQSAKAKDLVTHRFSLDEAQAAFEAAERGDGIKVIMVP